LGEGIYWGSVDELMIKTIIVEDKPPILWSIKQKIEGSDIDIKVVGEAYNGKEAISLIDELQPDIVFTDIKMPVMDGLELISQVKKKHSSIRFIIISGYDEFEYARQAMKLGVLEYILKPVTQETINEVLLKVSSEIHVQISQHKKNLLQNILTVGDTTDNIKVNFDYNHYILCVFCAGPYSSQTTDFANPFNFFWSRIDYNALIKKHLPQGVFHWCFDGKNLNEMVLLLGIPENSTFKTHDIINSIWLELLSFSTPITIAVGSKTCESHIIHHDEVQGITKHENQILDASLEKKLSSFVQGQQKTAFFKEFLKVMDYWEKNNFTQYNIENSLKYIVQICRKSTLENAESAANMNIEIEEVLSMSKDFPALSSGISSIFEPFFVSSKDSRHKREPLKEVIDNVQNYLKANYAKQITINDIADMVKVDPCHLSKTFKSIKGISPMDYLTNLRIEKSKELITQDSNLMLKDIAGIVGYTNQYYFSRIFKLVTGVSPTEYKNS
jgi:two-component system, response regulator YesN